MIVVGVIEDQWLDLLRVCANFLVQAAGGAKVTVRPYLLNDSDVPEAQDILNIQQEVNHYHSEITLPPITFLRAANLRETEQSKLIIQRLAMDGVNVIVSDSQMCDDEVAGLWLLNAALTEEGFKHRGWSCYLMTKHFESNSRFIYSREAGIIDSRIRYLDKAELLKKFPDDCAEVVSELLERESCASEAAARMAGKTKFGRFIGASKSLNDGLTSPYAVAQIAATTNSRLLIRGEAGSGKEVLAKAIHEESTRKQYAFVAVDCGALTDSMIESQLFGHLKGAFTGADRDFMGCIPAADKGTLFLDEIANMSVPAQAKLLRVLAEQEVTPLGATKSKKVDFRLISATNAPLERLIDSGQFLPDLFARIKTWQIALPPLRERQEDIPALVANLIPRLTLNVAKRSFVVGDGCIPMLQAASWPDNVRGLSDCIERAMGYALQTAVGHEVVITAEHVRLALPRLDGGVERIVTKFQEERPDPESTMTADEIWIGLRDHRLRRQSLPELVDRLGNDRVGAILILADDAIVSAKGLEKYFPGSSPSYKRKIKSRYLKRNPSLSS